MRGQRRRSKQSLQFGIRPGQCQSFYTNDLDTAIGAARTLRAGTVSVDAYSEGDITTPFGGFKESGFGGRGKGLEAFDQYTEKKTVWISVKA